MSEGHEELATRATSCSTMHVGVVHGVGAIHFVAVAQSRAGLMSRLAEYVRSQSDLQLFPQDAAVLSELLSRRDAEGAVRFYFDRVGRRWDREWLRSDVVPVVSESAD